MLNDDTVARSARGLSRLPAFSIVVVAGIAGAALLVGAWFGAADRTESSEQIAWVNLGVAGVLITAAVNGSWVLRGRQAVQHRLRAALAPPDLDLVDVAVRAEQPHLLGTAPRMTRYHNPECLLVGRKTLRYESRAGLERAGLRPCEMCTP